MNIYTDNTAFQQQSGITPIFITGNWYCFDDMDGQGNYDLSHVSNAAIDRAAIKLIDFQNPILLDIECFDLLLDYDNAVYNLQNALRRWKSANPKRLIGLYSIVPERNYWYPVRLHIIQHDEWSLDGLLKQRSLYKSWQFKNDKLASDLIPLMDFICPSLYAFTPTEDKHWCIYAETNLSEAFRVSNGKPIWPIIWPKYHDGSNIVMPMWAKMIEFISSFPGINNMVAYAPNNIELPNEWQKPYLELIK